MHLSPIVHLYRLCGRPAYSDGDFHGAAPAESGREFIEAIHADGRARFVDLLVDGDDYLNEDPIGANAKWIEFTLRLPQDSASTFHSNLAGLLARDPKIAFGEVPDDFYLVAEDYYSEEDEPPQPVQNLYSIMQLIRGLARLAYYKDSSAKGYNLIFLQPGGEAMPQPVEIQTRVTAEMIEYGKGVDTQLVDELLDEDARHDPHYTARIGVFGTALAQFVSGYTAERAFARLVQDWHAFVRIYQQDLATYISGFAFHKARRDVSKAELDIASQLSAVITDIAGKILSVPVSMIAVVAMVRASGWEERLLLLIGIGVASWLLMGAVRNQQSQLQRARHAKRMTLEAIQGRQDGFPDELRAEVDKMKQGLDDDEDRLARWLWMFYWVSVLPLVAAVAMFGWLYWEPIGSAAHSFWITLLG